MDDLNVYKIGVILIVIMIIVSVIYTELTKNV